jgi:hypothetical protein
MFSSRPYPDVFAGFIFLPTGPGIQLVYHCPQAPIGVSIEENILETRIGFSIHSKCSQQLAKNYQQSKIKSTTLT